MSKDTPDAQDETETLPENYYAGLYPSEGNDCFGKDPHWYANARLIDVIDFLETFDPDFLAIFEIDRTTLLKLLINNFKHDTPEAFRLVKLLLRKLLYVRKIVPNQTEFERLRKKLNVFLYPPEQL